MNSAIGFALLITAIGMGLVFAAILLLWGVMAVLVRLTKKYEEPEEVQISKEIADKKRKAVAAAVAVALALEIDNQPHEFPLPPTAIVSAWQAVMRSNILKRGRVR